MKRLKPAKSKPKLKRKKSNRMESLRKEMIRHIISHNACWSDKFIPTLEKWSNERLLANCSPYERHIFNDRLNLL